MSKKFNPTDDKFKVIISVGDDSGIGPEIILKALFSKEIPKSIDITIVGSKINLGSVWWARWKSKIDFSEIVWSISEE